MNAHVCRNSVHAPPGPHGTSSYRVFGLRFVSDRPIRALDACRCTGTGIPDVEIVHAPVAPPAGGERIDDMIVGAEGRDLVIAVPEAGTFRVEGGTRIVVHPWRGSTPAETELYLTGTVLGAVLHQRNILPIHCNAVAIGSQAFLFCGESGAGKSTLAAWFEARGYPLFTDDVCAVAFTEEGVPVAHAGIPRLRLWLEAVDLLGLSRARAMPIPWNAGKVELPMARGVATHHLPVAGIYALRTTEDGLTQGIEPITGLRAAEALTANIYRRRVADLVGRGGGYLAEVARLIHVLPVFSVNRRWGLDRLASEARTLEAHASALAAKRAASLSPSLRLPERG